MTKPSNIASRVCLLVGVTAALSLVDPSAGATEPKATDTAKAAGADARKAVLASGPFNPPSRPPPPPLSPAKRLKAMTKLATTLHGKLPKKLPPTLAQTLANSPASLEMRLTVLGRQLANGAQVSGLYGANVYFASDNAPDGVAYLFGNDTNGSWVRMKIPTEIGKLYVLDCRALEYDWQWDDVYRDGAVVHMYVGVNSGGDPHEVTTVDGHIVWAFAATEATSEVSIFYWGENGKYSRFLTWWGCDIGKAG